MFPIPTAVFLTRGVGVHRDQLTAFEYALREAEIEQQNLVFVSSMTLLVRALTSISGRASPSRSHFLWQTAKIRSMPRWHSLTSRFGSGDS